MNAESLCLVYRFSSGDEGLFCDTIFPKKPLCPIARKRRAMTGFKIPKTFAKRREATFEQKLPVSQSQNLFAIIRIPFFKRKAAVIVCFKTRRDGFFKRTIFGVGARKRIQQSASQ